MVERLSRYELGEIQRLHDEQHYRCASPEYVADQLKRIGLPARCSRFQVAMRIEEIEHDMKRRELGQRSQQT